jgi:hypothetical protein
MSEAFDEEDQDERDFKRAQSRAGKARGAPEDNLEPTAKSKAKPKPASDRFIKVPVAWLVAARKATTTSGQLAVALWLLDLSFMNMRRTFPAPNGLLLHPSGIEGLIVLARGPRYSASGFPA